MFCVLVQCLHLGGFVMSDLLSKMMSDEVVKGWVSVVYSQRKDRQVHPEGKFDNGQRWYPAESEDQLGTFSSIRSPSRQWPYSYLLRARTKQHVALLVSGYLLGRIKESSLPADFLAVSNFSAVKKERKKILIRALFGKKGIPDVCEPMFAACWKAGLSKENSLPWLVFTDLLSEHGHDKPEAIIRKFFPQVECAA